MNTTVRPKRKRTAKANEANSGKRAAACRRAKVGLLFAELATDRLAGLWRRLFPLSVDSGRELPDRQEMIEDLADFGQVLQPNQDGLTADQLCWMLDKFGRACVVMKQLHERLRASAYRSRLTACCRYRHSVVARAACKLL
jgi:hypothetical protein